MIEYCHDYIHHHICQEYYSIFGSTAGTTIRSTLMMHPMKCLKDYIENNMCSQRHIPQLINTTADEVKMKALLQRLRSIENSIRDNYTISLPLYILQGLDFQISQTLSRYESWTQMMSPQRWNELVDMKA
jgi:hypothetical protein